MKDNEKKLRDIARDLTIESSGDGNIEKINGKDYRHVTSPKDGQVVWYKPWMSSYGQGAYNVGDFYQVRIITGQYLSKGLLSNFWDWHRLDNGQKECGYGCFYVACDGSDTNLDFITVTIPKNDFKLVLSILTNRYAQLSDSTNALLNGDTVYGETDVDKSKRERLQEVIHNLTKDTVVGDLLDISL